MSDGLKDLAFLWDGSESGWVLHRVDHVEFTIEVGLPDVRARTLQRLRRVVPALRALSPIEARDALSSGTYRIRGLGRIEHQRFREVLASEGFDAHSIAEDLGRFLPVKDGMAMIIEDDDLALAATSRMLEAGVPVVEVYVD